MNIDRKILNQVYEELQSKITKKIIRSLQSIKDTMSGEDSGLINAWDEICAQVQGEESIFWNVYEDEIDRHIRGYVEGLKEFEKCLLWIYTQTGEEYYEKNANDDLVYNDEDIVDHIKGHFILSAAADYSNERIRNYLGV